MADNNIYRKILEKVSLDDLLNGVPALPPAGKTLLPSAVSSPEGLEEKTQPFENSEKAMDQRAAASHKLFADIHLYRKFKKSDFGSFRFPFLKKLRRLDYAQIVASGTAQRVDLTLDIIRSIERVDKTSVYLPEISSVDDLASLLSFSHMPYDNAPAEWPVVKEETEITKGYDLYENKSGKIGKIYYVLPHVYKYFANTTEDMRSTGYWKEKPSLGGMGIVYFGSSIKDEKHHSEVDYNLRVFIHDFFPKKAS